MNGLIQYFLHRSLFVNLLSIIMLVVGGWIIMNMNREAFPNIDYDLVSVTTIWPGASSQDVEKLITNPLEEKIKEVDGIKEYRSSTIESRSSINITIEPDAPNSQDVFDDIRSAVERAEDLPSAAERPMVVEISSSNLPVIQWSLARSKNKDGSFSVSYKKLRDIAESLEHRFAQIPGVARVARRGWRDAEIFVDMDPKRMQQYLIGSNDVVRALKRRNVSLPGGDILLPETKIMVRTVGEFGSAEEIKRVPVQANAAGASVKIRDIANVYEDFSDPDYIENTENSDTIALTLIKRESADIVTVVDASHKTAKKFEASLPPGIKLVPVNDFSYFVKRRLKVLFSNGLIGLVLVVGVLFLFLGWRTALMVALGVPISFGVAFIVMSYTGVSLNLISMFALIIVLGIIVDDAIIVSENFYRHLEKGLSPMEAAGRGSSEVFAPVLATIATTIAAFGPMLFMSGIFGKFIYTIPFVVILCLLGSFIESFVILPSHLYDMNRKMKPPQPGKKKKSRGNWFYKVNSLFYKPVLAFALRHKGLAFLSFVLLFFLSLAVQVFYGSFKLFPSAIDHIYVKVEVPVGTRKKELLLYTQMVGKFIERLPESELSSFISRVGVQNRDPNDPFTKRGSNYGMIMIYLQPEVDRKYSAGTIITWLREQTNWLKKDQKENEQDSIAPKIQLSLKNLKRDIALGIAKRPAISKSEKLRNGLTRLDFEKMAGGPPVGKPVAIEILGKDFTVLQKIADKYKEILSGIPGVKDIGDSSLPEKEEIQVKVNEDLAAQAGISVLDVATAVNTGFEGSIATSLRRPAEEVDVRVRFAQNYRNSFEALRQVRLSNVQGNLIQVERLAAFKKGKSITAINHLNGRRLISVTASLDESQISSAKAVQKVSALAKDIPSEHPQYTMQFSGENKDTEESLASLQRSFLLGLLIIFMILASLFRSLLQPFVILSAIPFALIGVILAFFFHGEPFSFMAFLGIVGLAGVVINDSIVLVDFANKLKQENPQMSNHAVSLEAGSMRLRPVLLTTLTTVGGLLPTAYGLGGYDPFLVPMALSFAWGLLFSTVLILIVVPILYTIVMDFQDWRREGRLLPDLSSERILVFGKRLRERMSHTVLYLRNRKN